MYKIRSLFICCLLLLTVALCCVSCAKSTEAAWWEQYDLGVRYLESGDYEQAVIAFEAAIEIDPGNAQGYAGLYAAYMAQGDEEQAGQVWAAMLEAGVSADEVLSWIEKMAGLITKAGGDGETVRQAAIEKARKEQEGIRPDGADGSSPAYVALQEKQISLSIVQTDIMADSVANSDGYAVVKLGEIYEDDVCISPRQQAIVDSAGAFRFPYSDQLYYLYSDGIVTHYGSDSGHAVYYDPNGPIVQGYYDLSGQPVLQLDKMEELSLRSFHDGIAFVRRAASIQSTQTIPAGDKTMTVMSAATQHTGCFIDKNGTVVLTLPDCFNMEIGFGASDFYKGWSYTGDVGWASEGLIPFWCKIQLGSSIFDFDEADLMRDVRELWEAPALCGFMDHSGNIVIPQLYTNYHPFSEGLAAVQDAAGLWGYIDKEGNTVIPFEYDSAGSFVEGLAAVSKDGKTGYINAQNEVVIPFEYEDGFGAGDGVCVVARNGKYCLVDYNNNEVLPFEYDDISTCVEGVVYAVKDQRLYIITVEQ